MLFRSTAKNTFRDYVQGTWGTFNTPAGRVEYIMTKARLGKDSPEPERVLTQHLSPVREVMDANALDFNQLLQRDLDDHRVATSLIPYLLKNRATGPAFFPPIMAVLLPFEDGSPSRFPAFDEPEVVDDQELSWKQVQAGDAFAVRRVIDANGEYHPVNLAQLRWNEHASRLVVLDGQHRAMALLAIDRTMSGRWRGSKGEKFRDFYEKQVQRYLSDEAISSDNVDLLSNVEVPVTVCWFPDRVGDTGHAHEAARKLFVDVNKEAKAPSESRIILLSDAELVNVLTRSMLSALRRPDNDELIPLYAVEYDNPDINTTRPARWSVMTNIHLLKEAVNRCVFGPPKYLTDVTKKISGREKKPDRDAFMRQQLEVSKLFKAEIQDEGFPYRREAIGNEYFPLGKVDVLSERFTETWGIAILTLLSKVAPYAAHARALRRMEAGWSGVEIYASLARDALFGGVGVYWTLKDSYEHYADESRNKPGANRGKPDSDVLRAWEVIEEKESAFEILRAEEYLGSTAEEKREASKAAYLVLNTHACQLGMVMTMGSLWELRKKEFKGKWKLDELSEFAQALARGWNAFFLNNTGKGKARDRRLTFSKTVSDPINQIPKLETARAVYFRYFWLQALATPESWEHVAEWFNGRDGFNKILSDARGMYLSFCVEERVKALKTSRPGQTDSQRRKVAEELATKTLRKALTNWFFVSETEAIDLLSADALASAAQEATTDPDDNGDSIDDGEDEDTRPLSYEELLDEE